MFSSVSHAVRARSTGPRPNRHRRPTGESQVDALIDRVHDEQAGPFVVGLPSGDTFLVSGGHRRRSTGGHRTHLREIGPGDPVGRRGRVTVQGLHGTWAYVLDLRTGHVERPTPARLS